ncbi:hypothetical protein Cha6605_4885 [Chamaesiphon minutus PCC 6605]|uniref:Uncharacterized protein n=1 Tax=Chamaesiphon minutus (strain ATCC 27169 / PCC 6605) TaxID=1173020 RepID=K9UN09_CHAP6|nr:hypothetical protein Cha6605_4885 [Chamaesiphon minutus PCC 6605]
MNDVRVRIKEMMRRPIDAADFVPNTKTKGK